MARARLSRLGKIAAPRGLRLGQYSSKESGQILGEVGGQYKAFLSRIGPQDVVLDLGTNLGILACECALRGARVHGHEPDAENYTLALEHLTMNNVNKIRLSRSAVVPQEPIRT